MLTVLHSKGQLCTTKTCSNLNASSTSIENHCSTDSSRSRKDQQSFSINDQKGHNLVFANSKDPTLPVLPESSHQ